MSTTVSRPVLVDGVVGAAAIGLTVASAPAVRHWYRRWGATSCEARAPMAGDELVPAPKMESTRAVTVRAPAAAVWPWLVQIGHGRGGLYSYDLLENLVGCDLHSADEILDEHQELRPGDLVRMGPPGYPCFAVVDVRPPATLVLMGVDPTAGTPPSAASVGMGATVGSTWQWQLRPLTPGRSRLVVRQRLTYPRRQAVVWHLTEPVSFVMERRMLLGIKQRAEQTNAPSGDG